MISLKNPAIRITLIALFITTWLSLAKLGAGFYGRSHALFADGLHSVADIFVDIFVIFAAHYGAQQADENHPYGHGRIETAVTFILALLLLLTGLGIIIDADKHVWGHIPAPIPNDFVLVVAVIAIILNEILFRWTLLIAKNNHSALLEANAWHSRSDAAVSIIVLLGIIGALLGFTYLDALGAIFVGMMIGKMGLNLAWKSISELVDTGVDEKTVRKIKKIIAAVEGVRALHLLRTRTINHKIFIDVHILVSPTISVSEGHFIGDQVRLALYKLPDIYDITVHVDPEDDEKTYPSSQLPSREAIMSLIKSDCDTNNIPIPEDIKLHYLNGKIDIELWIKNPPENYSDNLNGLNNAAYVGKITVVITN